MTQVPAYTLALNAAEGLLQIALFRQEPSGEYSMSACSSWNAPSQGAELLAPALQDALARLKITPKDIGRIAAVCGPGSFTGLRLVLATASGLARAVGASSAGIEYLPLLAVSASLKMRPFATDISSRIWVTTHARRNLVHLQGFAVSPAQTTPLLSLPGKAAAPFAASASCEPLSVIKVCTPEEALHFIREQEKSASASCLILGSGLDANRPYFEAACVDEWATGPRPILLPQTYSHPSPEGLFHAAATARYANGDVAPLYVRSADAEENLERIAATLNLDPEAARKRFTELTTETLFHE